jgi:hypothetical protein
MTAIDNSYWFTAEALERGLGRYTQERTFIFESVSKREQRIAERFVTATASERHGNDLVFAGSCNPTGPIKWV